MRAWLETGSATPGPARILVQTPMLGLAGRKYFLFLSVLAAGNWGQHNPHPCTDSERSFCQPDDWCERHDTVYCYRYDAASDKVIVHPQSMAPSTVIMKRQLCCLGDGSSMVGHWIGDHGTNGYACTDPNAWSHWKKHFLLLSALPTETGARRKAAPMHALTPNEAFVWKMTGVNPGMGTAHTATGTTQLLTLSPSLPRPDQATRLS